MRTKSYFITILLCFITLLFATEFIFADNIGRAVYGVITETYNGTSVDNTSAGADNVRIDGSGYNNTNRIEGSYSKSVGWLNWFGIAFYTPQNMSDYNGGRIYFSAKVPDYIDITDNRNLFKVADGSDKVVYFNSDNIKRIDNGPSTEILGTKISNDNQWHTYYIDLYSFINPSNSEHLNFDNNITYLFIVGLRPQVESEYDTVLIDNVYWTKAQTEPRAFSVTVKNRSDNQAPTNQKITWTQAAYRQSWTAAEQYIELDLDKESSNWHVRIYLDNAEASRKGLWCTDGGVDIVLPMAWRIRPDLLPNSSGDTLNIAEYYEDTGEEEVWGLYDIGKNPGGTDWFTWCPMREKKAGIDYEDVVVWDLKGLHTVVWKHNSYDPLTNYFERKPKIYFAADCSNAIGGLTYTANVVTELVYE